MPTCGAGTVSDGEENHRTQPEDGQDVRRHEGDAGQREERDPVDEASRQDRSCVVALIGPNSDPCPEAWAALTENRGRKELNKVAPASKPSEKPKGSAQKFDQN